MVLFCVSYILFGETSPSHFSLEKVSSNYLNVCIIAGLKHCLVSPTSVLPQGQFLLMAFILYVCWPYFPVSFHVSHLFLLKTRHFKTYVSILELPPLTWGIAVSLFTDSPKLILENLYSWSPAATEISAQ